MCSRRRGCGYFNYEPSSEPCGELGEYDLRDKEKETFARSGKRQEINATTTKATTISTPTRPPGCRSHWRKETNDYRNVQVAPLSSEETTSREFRIDRMRRNSHLLEDVINVAFVGDETSDVDVVGVWSAEVVDVREAELVDVCCV